MMEQPAVFKVVARAWSDAARRAMTRRLPLAGVLLCGALLGAQPSFAQSTQKTILGVFWRGCEEACRGFQDYLAERNIDARFVIRDAARDEAKLPVFLEEARRMKANLILTWGTSATLGVAGTLDDADDPRFNNDIPQVFTVVADPVGARVVETLDKTGRHNVTGTFNRVPEAVNINTIRSYLPSFKRLGLLYNANEPNSLLKRQEIADLTRKLDFELVDLELPLGDDGKPRVADIPARIAMLKEQGVDFIYLGSSSFLDVNRDVFTVAAVENGIPVLSPYERLVRESQGLLSIAARYYDVGRLAARQAERILVDGQVPGDIPVARMTDFAYVINMAVARKLNLFPPVAILQFAETVH
jgi:putative ABC transport system substrate-binding protein